MKQIERVLEEKFVSILFDNYTNGIGYNPYLQNYHSISWNINTPIPVGMSIYFTIDSVFDKFFIIFHMYTVGIRAIISTDPYVKYRYVKNTFKRFWLIRKAKRENATN